MTAKKKPPASATYEVGYAKPPLHSRWKKGEKGGNPSGRPKGSNSLKAAMTKSLRRRVVARGPDGRKRQITHFDGICETLLSMVYEKNLAAMRLLLEFMKVAGVVVAEEGDSKGRSLSPEEEALFSSLIASVPSDDDGGPGGTEGP